MEPPSANERTTRLQTRHEMWCQRCSAWHPYAEFAKTARGRSLYCVTCNAKDTSPLIVPAQRDRVAAYYAARNARLRAVMLQLEKAGR